MSQFVGSHLKWTDSWVLNVIFQTKLNGYSRGRFSWQIPKIGTCRKKLICSKLNGKIWILDFEPDVWMKISGRLTLTFLISWLIGLWSLIRAITVSIFRVESWNCWKSVFKTISELWNCVYKTIRESCDFIKFRKSDWRKSDFKKLDYLITNLFKMQNLEKCGK